MWCTKPPCQRSMQLLLRLFDLLVQSIDFDIQMFFVFFNMSQQMSQLSNGPDGNSRLDRAQGAIGDKVNMTTCKIRACFTSVCPLTLAATHNDTHRTSACCAGQVFMPSPLCGLFLILTVWSGVKGTRATLWKPSLIYDRPKHKPQTPVVGQIPLLTQMRLF